MESLWKRKILSLPASIILSLALVALTFGITFYAYRPLAENKSLTDKELYRSAIIDSMVAEEDEHLPLMAITRENELVRWSDDGEKVLLASWHKYPESYVPDSEVNLKWGEVWVFLPLELAGILKTEGTSPDEVMRLRQLVGLPPDCDYTHFTLMWADVDDLLRPCYDTEIDDTSAELAFDGTEDKAYETWFNSNIISSYFPAAYPWTRLGYTYDWSGDGSEYGVSEFIIKKGSSVTVEDTMTTKEFLDYLNAA